MNHEIEFRFLKWSIIFRYLLIISFIINGINAQKGKSFDHIGNQKYVFEGHFGHNKRYLIDDCIPLAFGDFNADRIVDIFCRNTKGNSIRVMLNDDRSTVSKEQYVVNITYVKLFCIVKSFFCLFIFVYVEELFLMRWQLIMMEIVNLIYLYFIKQKHIKRSMKVVFYGAIELN